MRSRPMIETLCGHEQCRVPLYTQRGYARRTGTGCKYKTVSARRLSRCLVSLGIIKSTSIVCINRVRAGHWQRSQGAWSFWAQTPDGNDVAGSQWSVAEILQAEKTVGISCYMPDHGGTWDLSPKEKKPCDI